jgi:glycosyltransferase involved in cell wall biosynthesis
VDVFTATTAVDRDLAPPGVVVHRLQPLARVGNAPFVPGLLRLAQVDLIHLHYPFIFGAEMVWVAARRRQIPYVLTYHNDLLGTGVRGALFDAYSALFSRVLLGGARKLAIVSQDHAMSCRLAPIFRRRMQDVVEIPNGVDTAIFRPRADGAAARNQHAIASDRRVILFVGALDRAHYFKGLPSLLSALNRVRTKTAHLLVVGDGDLRSTYAQLAVQLGVAERVTFVGAIGPEHLPPYYAASDLVVLPSLPPESFGIVLIEAMACGRPVIGSNIPGVRKVIDNGVDGLLANPGDTDDLAEKIDLLLGDSAGRERMGQVGRDKVNRLYSAEAVARRLEEMYLQVLDGPVVGPVPGHHLDAPPGFTSPNGA